MIAVYLSPLYILVNIGLYIQIVRWLGACAGFFKKIPVRVVIGLVYLFFVLTIPIAFFLPAGHAQRIFKLLGNYWLGVELYLVLFVAIADIVYLIRKLIVKKKSRSFHIALGAVCAAAIVGTSAWGIYNARVIRVTPYEISVDKDGGDLDELNVVLIGDLHMGYNVGVRHIAQMVEKINAQNPDIVLIAGDIFDNEYEALEDEDALIGALAQISSKYGVYACYGNHDVQEKILAGFTFGGSANKESSEEMDAFLEKAGITLLQDEAVLIANSVYVYGRPDAKRPGRGIDVRKTAEEIMESLDTGKPVIVLEHEPNQLGELSEAGADVSLCGHTHDGQVFPANIVTSLMWENSYGYLLKDGMDSIVTSGVGVFGPNMRVGTIAEICTVKITFE